MTKKQMEDATALAMKIDPEKERVQARDKRHEEFWTGLKKVDYAIRSGVVTAQDRIRGFFTEDIRTFDKGRVQTPALSGGNWSTIEYIGSFEMTYTYTDVLPINDDKPEEFTYYTIAGGWDSLDEVSLTELLRKELTRYLIAGGALAKRIGSSTYEGWVTLITDINLTHRNSFCIFFKEYPYDDFRTRLEELEHHLWADALIAQHTSTHT